MEEAWSYQHSLECPVYAGFAWRYWSDVRNWRLDADVESVELMGAFAAGTKGVTNTRSRGGVAWQLASVEDGKSATVEVPLDGAVARFAWTFEDLGDRSR